MDIAANQFNAIASYLLNRGLVSHKTIIGEAAGIREIKCIAFAPEIRKSFMFVCRQEVDGNAPELLEIAHLTARTTNLRPGDNTAFLIATADETFGILTTFTSDPIELAGCFRDTREQILEELIGAAQNKPAADSVTP